ncbi:MAG: hypothetical protein AAGA95_22255, partial [Pseudomonadota bacterium]
ETWRERLGPLAKRARNGVLIAVSDTVEREFPFEGRVKLSRPGTVLERILGRAEKVRETYIQRLEANRAELTSLAAHIGWRLIEHTTDDAPIKGAAALHAALCEMGAPA